MKPQHPRKKVKDPASRTAPDIPVDIQQIALDVALADPEISFRECLVENVMFKDRSFQSVVFETCLLKQVSFTRCILRSLRLKDVRLIECDFANAEVIGLKLSVRNL
jgi:uncharacterized protein YjbI with pentapeptide repeats